MMHELQQIIHQAMSNQKQGLQSVLASVVHLNGSSYRKPGVRMLICENGNMTGAVSGGCVEQEINRRAQAVFNNKQAKVMTYDGRFRLGCEGLLYILLEPIQLSSSFLEQFHSAIKNREEINVKSTFIKEDGSSGDFGTSFQFQNKTISLREGFHQTNYENYSTFTQLIKPSFQLKIIGAEHDAVKLCTMANLLGFNVEVITSMKDPKTLVDFPGAKKVFGATPKSIDFSTIDDQTAVVLMTHNYALDLHYLIKLRKKQPAYIGILGSANRRERMQSELFELAPDFSIDFLDEIYSPAGLHIGAITPEEIALSILAEILAVTRNKEVISLKEISGKIHT